MKTGRKLDHYTVNARLLPALFVGLPIGLAAMAWSAELLVPWSIIWALIAWCGGSVLLSQMGRDQGKRKEHFLYSLWGGKPTTTQLRHRNTKNCTMLERRHQNLMRLMRQPMPSAQQENFDPKAADEFYETCIMVLRDKTRNASKYPLVFEENCNYGFRRNLWGMKPIGVSAALLATVAIAVVPVFVPVARSGEDLYFVIVLGLVGFLLLMSWVFVISPSWVRVPADAYAERLLECTESLT